MAKQLPPASEDLPQPQVANVIVEIEDLDQVNTPPAAMNHEQSNQLQPNSAVPIVTDVDNNDSFVMPAEVSVLQIQLFQKGFLLWSMMHDPCFIACSALWEQA